MPNYKVVDADQLDTDLVSVADAIRAKGSTSDSFVFPGGFIGAISDIQAGGGSGEWTTDGIADGSEPNGAITINVSSIILNAFHNRSKITHVNAPNLTTIAANAFNGTGMTSYNFPVVTRVGQNAFMNTKIAEINLPNLQGTEYGCFSMMKSLIKADMPSGLNSISGYCFGSDASLTTIILRNPNGVSLVNANAFNGTPFASGGSGGTIYIPQALIDSEFYKTATNWSVLDAYGTVTWAAIEGSDYE